jgi:lipopolysaccharide/colanic/teichoic acid biosynthesis glycosyltransferase
MRPLFGPTTAPLLPLATTGYTAEAVVLDGRSLSAWMLAGAASPGTGWVLKRALDVALAALALVLVAPLLLAAAAAIRASGPGPIVFKQQRIGYRGRPFTMYKLRTMVAGADAQQASLADRANGPVFFKLADDPRVTRVGRFLRRTSIDELPQLVNVLAGDMSLVGPRPLLPSDASNLHDSHHRTRFATVPGITGLWQVSGRSACSDAERLRYDTEYVRNWSLSLDFRILLRTLPVVLTAKGAV